MKNADVAAVDARIMTLVQEQQDICIAMSGAVSAGDDVACMLPRLIEVTQRIAEAQFEREEIIRATFHR